MFLTTQLFGPEQKYINIAKNYAFVYWSNANNHLLNPSVLNPNEVEWMMGLKTFDIVWTRTSNFQEGHILFLPIDLSNQLPLITNNNCIQNHEKAIEIYFHELPSILLARQEWLKTIANLHNQSSNFQLSTRWPLFAEMKKNLIQ